MTVIRRCGSQKSNNRIHRHHSVLQHKLKNDLVDSDGGLLAVETNDEETLKSIISKTKQILRSEVKDIYLKDWTLLEIAIMLGHRQCAEILLQNGAAVNVEDCPMERRLQQIRERSQLLADKIQSLRVATIQYKMYKHGRHLQDKWEELLYLEKRLEQLRIMKAVVQNTILLKPLTDIQAVVSGSDQVTVYWQNNWQQNVDLVVNYKVEWSLCDDFSSIEGSLQVNNVTRNEFVISTLKHGLRYSVRVSAATIRGYSYPTRTTPPLLLVSSILQIFMMRCSFQKNSKVLKWNSIKKKSCSDDIAQLLMDVQKYRSSPIWQTLFPKINETDKKKKGSKSSFFAGASRLPKVVQSGIYLVSIIYSEMKICTIDEYLPIFLIDHNKFCISKEEMYWAMKMSLAWNEMQIFRRTGSSASSNSYFRNKFIDAAMEMHALLGVNDIGRVHHEPIVDEVNSVSFILTIRFANGIEVCQSLATKWLPLHKVARKRGGIYQAIDILWDEISRILSFFESSYLSLQKGLYMFYMKLHSSLNSVNVLVRQKMPSVLPYTLIRENPHITKEEWDWLRLLEINAFILPTPIQFRFHKALLKAANRLLQDLEVDVDLIPDQRLYRLQVFTLRFGVSFIILSDYCLSLSSSIYLSLLQLFPKVEDVCTAPRSSSIKLLPIEKGCIPLPLQVFEIIHYCTYDASFISNCCRLSLFIEHFSTLVQYEQRSSLLEKDIVVYAGVLTKLDEFQQRLETICKSMRWIGDIVSIARDEQAKCAISLAHLLFVCNIIENKDCNEECRKNDTMTQTGILRPRLESKSDTPPTNIFPQLWLDNRPVSLKSSPKTKVIKVNIAYQSGPTCGSSVRVQVAPTTTASEVVALVIRQLPVTARTSEETSDSEDFCLSSVVGCRERRLRDDFPLIQLQKPWSDGRLFVRRQDSILAALQQGNEATI
ncbi:unnamed protein product [Thelazia callipaeda]|uniref:Ankyrin repeat and fibronectin type-III domain-containing protein 1 n=1 Tax=Thelazia callipaeda TaxID=103827 RepID=A0A0N5D2F1_THECL|nr:unnamed protein product [Thelazia callipaeda]